MSKGLRCRQQLEISGGTCNETASTGLCSSYGRSSKLNADQRPSPHPHRLVQTWKSKVGVAQQQRQASIFSATSASSQPRHERNLEGQSFRYYKGCTTTRPDHRDRVEIGVWDFETTSSQSQRILLSISDPEDRLTAFYSPCCSILQLAMPESAKNTTPLNGTPLKRAPGLLLVSDTPKGRSGTAKCAWLMPTASQPRLVARRL
jgi:hypothetical protein